MSRLVSQCFVPNASRWLVLGIVAHFALLGISDSLVKAQTTDAPQGQLGHDVDAAIAEIAANAKKDVQNEIGGIEASSSLRPDHIEGFDTLSSDAQAALQRLLSANLSHFDEELAAFVAERHDRRKEIANAWAGVNERLQSIDQKIRDREKALADEKHWTSRLGLSHRDTRFLWLSVFLAFGGLLGCAAYVRRHAVRRMRYGTRSRSFGPSRYLGVLAAVVVFGVLAVVLAMVGNPSNFSSGSITAPPRTPLPENDGPLDEASRETANPSEDTGWSEPDWQSIRGQLQEALVDMEVARQIGEKLKVDAETLRNKQDDIGEIDQQIAAARRHNQMIALAIGWGAVALVAVGGGWLLNDIRRRNRVRAETCPLCLSVGTLEHQPLAQGTPKQFQKLVCRNVISTDPPEDCNFNFYSYYQPMSKLCFPTLGHPRAGKTHWLSMVYRELNRGNFTEHVEFEAIKSESSEDFERVVDEILESRMDPERTQTATIPRPLLFNFRDRDRIGKSSVLITMFDYSGEVVASMTLDDSQRRRALEADGYLFFLDPMEIAEPQAKELVRFREDVRIVKGIGAGERIHAPVALCVPKIDLLVNHPTAGQDRTMIEQFYDELARIDPTGQEISLDVIEARSKLIAPMCGMLWPGWQVERQIRSLFGGRYMFFPLTPVGLAEPGETDLRNRTIEPFGILEPLLWLLQMNGHPVLD